MGIQLRSTGITLKALGGLTVGSSQYSTQIQIILLEGNKKLLLRAFVIRNVGITTPSADIDSCLWSHLRNIKFADPFFYKSRGVDLVLGTQIYSSILQSGLQKSPLFNLTAQSTSLGWIVMGSSKKNIDSINNNCVFITFKNQESYQATYDDLPNIMQRFWKLEEVQLIDKATEEEKNVSSYL